MNTKNTLPLFAIVLIGALLAFLILRTDKTSRGNGPPEEEGEIRKEAAPKGPHGGRLLSREDFQIEITIYEKGVPPQFRVYPYKKGKPIDPAEVQLTVTLHRLGGRVDEIRFKKEGDYLRGDRVIEEPHSFDLQVVAKQGDQTAEWRYAQIEGRVEMTPEVAKASGIEIGTAGPVRMKTVLALPGEIGLNRNKMAQIVPRVSGIVTDVRKNLSDPVKKGEIIALLDSRELAAAKSDYIESLHRLEFAQATFVREESLWKKKISAEEDYLLARHRLEEAEIAKQVTEQKLLVLGVTPAELTALGVEPEGTVKEREVRTPLVGKALTHYELRSPINGTVIEKRVAVGEAVKEDAPIFIIADLSTVWGEITVYAKDLNVVRLGQQATITSKELGIQATGKVSYIGPLVGEETRAAKAHVDIPNPERLWRPGLFVTVEVVREEVPVPVAVSAGAIQTYREWKVVFVQYGNQFEARPLELGRSDGKWVEVVSGLSPGENYAVKNSFLLKADLGKSGAAHDH